ncbi:MAG TPA: hypothetical protein VHW43_04835 [Puia sp.]|nr:hypothetical protein [Puia sp.]
MRSTRTIFSLLLTGFLASGTVFGQTAPPPQQQDGPGPQQQPDWPRSFTTDDGTVVKIYQPQPEGFSDNVLKSRWAISVLQPGKTDPVFGTFWSVANVETDRDNRRVVIQSAKVPNVRFPGQPDDNFIGSLKTALESNLPQVAGDLSLDQILAGLDENTEQKKLSKDLNTQAPRVIYANEPSLLVMIDGQPKLQNNKDWGLDVVVNSPFTIVKANNGNFYLYGGKHWYQAQSATGPYSPAGNIPSELNQVQSAVDNANSSNAGYQDSAAAEQDKEVSNIIVSTSPAELIQTNGQANFASIPGTGLSYATNSMNDIFQDGGSGKYFVLISGRWYSSGSLDGGWHYVASNALPADFAKIPEGSPKDNVLASVAGTDAAREAVMDAQIPQTAKVDRNTASTTVNYNGDPQFAPLQGTDMQYATNTGSNVMEDHGVYYTVDNGVWFQSAGPNGPWTVATERPEDVDRIPPTSPLYNTKYVYIYDVTPDDVYMGYTPGYLNTYIYGPTVVYGTGYNYNPWYNGFYYPRPWTWGFNVFYNPWAGWSLGYGYGFGWFHFGIGGGWGGGWRGWGGGGWWGPHMYHPAYGWGGYRNYGFYGPNAYRNRNIYASTNFHTNIYAGRGGVVTRDNHSFYNRTSAGRPLSGGIGRPIGTGGAARPGVSRPGNVFSDRQGNVYQRNQSTNQWQQRGTNNSWRPVQNRTTTQSLNRQQQQFNRGQVRTQNFQQARTSPASRPSGGSSRPSGGGARPSGGGGGGRRH